MPSELKFPSVDWLSKVSQVFNGDDSYRGAGSGTCDCTVGIQVGKNHFQLVFEGFECAKVNEIDQSGLDECDFYLSMPKRDWRAMLDNISEHGHATDNYTLNTLDLGRPDGLSMSTHNDQYREDLFFRYNQTLQFFFNASSKILTSY